MGKYRCKNEVLKDLKNSYKQIVLMEYNNSYLEALKNFDYVAEEILRESVMQKYYKKTKSLNQAWKSCKGALYEYAVFESLQEIIKKMNLKGINIFLGENIPENYNKQIIIKNWCEIYPDVDILIVKKNKVVAIISCKTSLRERLTETAFWKRELEKRRENIKLLFITTDKDDELKNDTNRYILLHVIDCTFVTNPLQYERLIEHYEEKYGYMENFGKLIEKVKLIDEIGNFLKTL